MKQEDVYESKDKRIVPFLLTQKDLDFVGTETRYDILFFKFSPFEKCLRLVNEYMARKAPLVQPKDLLDAVDTYRDRVFEMKDKRMKYEIPKNNQY